jgi:hypothetical protein
MESFLKELHLSNGLTIGFIEQTRRYFGDYYLVKLEIICKVPVTQDFFTEESSFAEARAILGDTVVYRRNLEQMGVPSTEIDRVLTRLVTDFEEHSLPYFAAGDFPQKLVVAELKKRKKIGHPGQSSRLTT